MVAYFVQRVVELVGDMGYPGIFALMTIESSFIPFPSEVVIIPAGYQVHLGNMSFIGVLLSGVGGSLAGALINYYLSLCFGRRFILKYGKYFFLPQHKFQRLENAFLQHGAFATFVGRLIFGVRQWISVPAGLARMRLLPFVVLTSLGAGIWVIILALLGYLLGVSQESHHYAKVIGYWLLGVVCIISLAYFYWKAPKGGKSSVVENQDGKESAA
ncbi:MAG: DedA family protein [Candidatus Dadabacteria bacterium]|nr:MAG: DedA family protein [Candidatus Dadabacteria bacterium]